MLLMLAIQTNFHRIRQSRRRLVLFNTKSAVRPLQGLNDSDYVYSMQIFKGLTSFLEMFGKLCHIPLGKKHDFLVGVYFQLFSEWENDSLVDRNEQYYVLSKLT